MNKNIALCVVLTIVTCGIYGIYWLWCINEAACAVNPAEWNTSGGLVILFSILTCGIYGIYWNYKMGRAFAPINGTDNSVLYLLLSVFGLEIVNFCIIQSDINRAYPV